MFRLDQGGLRLFRAFGVNVFVHWSWLLFAAYRLQTQKNTYSSPIWLVIEYLTVFGIVMLHEFGHALACRSVGGFADRIVLWPLGGVAYCDPPPRPGATLWTSSAGPLVNVVLIPVTFLVASLAAAAGAPHDVRQYLSFVKWFNVINLVFNVLPIYPLDGGKIVRSILWSFLGRATSLRITAIIGIVVGALVGVAALVRQDSWLVVLAIFGVMQALQGYREAERLAKLIKLPRHIGLVCKTCGASPPMAPLWTCSCGMRLDPFAGNCPRCGGAVQSAPCIDCGRTQTMAIWRLGRGAGAAARAPGQSGSSQAATTR